MEDKLKFSIKEKKTKHFVYREKGKKSLRFAFKYSSNKIYHKISVRQILTLLSAQRAVELANRLHLFNRKTMLKINTSKRIPTFKKKKKK